MKFGKCDCGGDIKILFFNPLYDKYVYQCDRCKKRYI